MLSCKELSEKASDCLDGELSPRSRMQIRLHMFLCEHCRRYLRQMRLAVDAVALSAGSDKGEDAGEDRIVRALSLSPTIDPPREGIAPPEVVIYTTSWCPYCRSAKALLARAQGRRLRRDRGRRQPGQKAGDGRSRPRAKQRPADLHRRPRHRRLGRAACAGSFRGA